jgi:hypothetical protein
MLKMKKFYLFFALVAFTANLFAQITVTDASFPAAGDTLKYATDLNPDGVVITPANTNSTVWDFSGLAPTVKSETVFRAAAEGSAAAEFPTASLVTISEGGQNETYYSVSATSFTNLGFFGVDPTGGLPIPTTFRFDPPVAERRAPMNILDINQSASSLGIAFAIADLGPLADSLGPLAGIADSIRIRGTAERLDFVDAHGSLTIPGGTYDVLREKRTEYRDTRLDIHSFLGWQDITDLIPTGGFGDGLGTDTTITYLFFSNTEKEIIAEVSTGSDGLVPQSVTYKDNGVISNNSEVLGTDLEVLVSPNPANGQAVFSLKNRTSGEYSLRLMDARGQVALRSNLNQTDNAIQLQGMSSGTYFYQVFDENNRAVASGKLLIVNQ